MSSADPNEGDSTESFVDVEEYEVGREQNPEFYQKEKSPEKSERRNRNLQAEGELEEEESWETVPENEKDLPENGLLENKGPRNENGEESPSTGGHNQTSDAAEDTKPVTKTSLDAADEGDQNGKPDGLSQEEDSNQPKECKGEETQTNNSEQTHNGDLQEETKEHQGSQETTTQSTKPEGEDGTRETIDVSETTKQERTQETTTMSDPTEPEEAQETTTMSEPTEPEEAQETTTMSEPTEPEDAQETTANGPKDREATQEMHPAEQEKSEEKPQQSAGKENSENEIQDEGDQEEPEESSKGHNKSVIFQEPKRSAGPAQHMEESGEPGSHYPTPVESMWTVHKDSAVTLRMEGSGSASIPPLTVPEFFSQAVMKFDQRVALCVRSGDGWEEITYRQYKEHCRMVARGLLGLGLARFSGVLILGRTSPQWFIAHIGAIMAGGVAVGVDPSCTGSFCLGAALDSQAQVVMVQDGRQLQKILEVRERLTGLKAIVQWEGEVEETQPLIYTWERLCDLGSEVEESRLHQVLSQQKTNLCCAVVYESAIEPLRGVLLSHDNVTWTCRAVAESLALGSEERVVSYLPPSHMTAQMFDLWLPLCCGGRTYFTDSDDLQGSLLAALKAVRPTYFLGFPRFWEKVRRKWMLAERKGTPLQKKILRWAQETALQACGRCSCRHFAPSSYDLTYPYIDAELQWHPITGCY
ncbi:long-chain-fatty-acid--CoA ligase ACSBG2-like [Mantella aurantiaca]